MFRLRRCRGVPGAYRMAPDTPGEPREPARPPRRVSLRSTRRQTGPKRSRGPGLGRWWRRRRGRHLRFPDTCQLPAGEGALPPRALSAGTQTFSRGRTLELYVRALGSQGPWVWLGAPFLTPAPGVGASPSARVLTRRLEGEPPSAPLAAKLRAGERGGCWRGSGLPEAAGPGPDSGRPRETGERLSGARAQRERRDGRRGLGGGEGRACSPPRCSPSLCGSAGGGGGWPPWASSPQAARPAREGAKSR